MPVTLPTLPPAAWIRHTGLLLPLGALGGWLMAGIGAPMPWLTGALAATVLGVVTLGHLYPEGYRFPDRFRMLFVGMIGVLIGSRVDPGMFAGLSTLAVSFAAVAVFVLAAQVGNFVLFRRLGGYDRATAWFSGSPGGLIEAVTMGEEAGADVRVMTLLQFLRIIVVVTTLPFALSLYHGHAVGSAAGTSFGGSDWGWSDLVLIAVFIAGGLMLGQLLRLPARQLTGPLVFAAIVSLSGLVPFSPPGWAAPVAQVVLGVGLGTRFFGINGALLWKCIRLSAVSVVFMLAMGAALAELVSLVTGLGFEIMFISLAPGGVTEMGLVALSLSANPAFVALHHLFRIALTVLLLGMARRLGVLPRNTG